MALETLSLDGLSLNSGASPGQYTLTALSMPPPKKRPEWITRSDGDGDALLRDPLFENRTIEATVETIGVTRDAAQQQVNAIVKKLEDADQTPGGIQLVWRAAGASKALTYFVLSGEITDLPIDVASGYYNDSPLMRVQIVLTCRPYGYEPEVAGPSASGSTPLVSLTVSGVPGDVPADGRLVVSDQAGQQRDFVAWSLEQRYQSATNLTLTANLLTTAGTAGTAQATAGSYSALPIRAGLLQGAWTTVAGTGDQPHVGLFRVICRCFIGLNTVLAERSVRLAYRMGDGPLLRNRSVVVPTVNQWFELDLGTINVPPAPAGAQRWQGFIEATTSQSVLPDLAIVDLVELMPALEGFGKAHRTLGPSGVGAYTALDNFNQTAGGLTTKAMDNPPGGSWVNPIGDGDDWQVDAVNHTATRNTASDTGLGRGLIAGATSSAATLVQGTVSFTSTANVTFALVARWLDWNNFVMFVWKPDQASAEIRRITAWNGTNVMAWNRIAIASVPFPGLANTPYGVRGEVTTDGKAAMFVWPQPYTQAPSSPVAVGASTDLKTGGALASGRVGMVDYHQSGTFVTTTLKPFVAANLAGPADAVAFPNRQVHFRDDDTLRQDASGTWMGRPQTYRGAPFRLPAAGDNNSPSRITVLAREFDIETTPSLGLTDTTQLQVFYSPRWVGPPR